MTTFNANYWEDTATYVYKKTAKAKRSEKKRISKKEEEKKRKDRNSSLKGVAKHYANGMKEQPSALEQRMQEFLENQGIQYEFQKPLYIKNRDGSIQRFYIADFYIPTKGLIIETDGKFHDDQIKEDEERTKEIQKYHPNMKIIRWRWHDFDSYQKMKDLVARLK